MVEPTILVQYLDVLFSSIDEVRSAALGSTPASMMCGAFLSRAPDRCPPFVLCGCSFPVLSAMDPPVSNEGLVQRRPCPTKALSNEGLVQRRPCPTKALSHEHFRSDPNFFGT